MHGAPQKCISASRDGLEKRKDVRQQKKKPRRTSNLPIFQVLLSCFQSNSVVSIPIANMSIVLPFFSFTSSVVISFKL